MVSAASFAQEYVPGEVIVKLKGKSKSINNQAFIGKAVSEKQMGLKGSWSGMNMHHFRLPDGKDVGDAVNELQNDPAVEYAEPNYIIHKQSSGVESQMSYDEFQAMAVQATSSGSGVSTFSQTNAPIQVSQGWAAESSTTFQPVVAIIDTGIWMNHTIFTNSGAIWTNPKEIVNGIDDDSNGYIDDIHGWNFAYGTNDPTDDDGHGTHVSGIVLGTTIDIQANPIATSKVKLMALKFLDSTGSGSTSDAINAIYYAVNNGAHVLSNSWGGGGFSNALLQAIAYAYTNKKIFVAAAGNASSNNDSSPTYPANYNVPSLISVAASTDADTLASFSNFGATTVHLGAPGVSILSTLPNNSFGYESGTSMATPFVSGVAALILRENPTLTGYQIKNLLFGATNAVTGLNGKVSTNARLNVYNAVMAAKGATPNPVQPSYDVSNNLRSPTSDAAAAPAGCGLLAQRIFDDQDPDNTSAPMRGLSIFAMLVVLLAPVVLVSVLRRRTEVPSRRRHERFLIDSEVRLRVGDRELSGSVSTISLGGVQLNADTMLEKGGIVTMSIASPDGREEIQVKGMVVWIEEQKHYGVQFAEADPGTLSKIGGWTRSLLKAD